MIYKQFYKARHIFSSNSSRIINQNSKRFLTLKGGNGDGNCKGSQPGKGKDSGNKGNSRIRMNFAPECELALNKHINLELYASYVYFQMVSFRFLLSLSLSQ